MKEIGRRMGFRLLPMMKVIDGVQEKARLYLYELRTMDYDTSDDDMIKHTG